MATDFKANLTKFVRGVFRANIVQNIDYLAKFTSTVVSQNADGSLELIPDDVRLPHFNNVQIRYGIPGVKVTIAIPGRVILEFTGADPTKPVATVWEATSVVSLTLLATTINIDTAVGSTINIGGAGSQVNLGTASALVARVGDAAICGPYAGVVTASTQTVTKA